MTPAWFLIAMRWFILIACISFLPLVFLDGAEAYSGQDPEDLRGNCEVVSFEAFEESQAVLTPAGDYTVTATRECAAVTIRNIYRSDRHAEDFLFTAIFSKGDYAEGGFDLTPDKMKRRISPGDTYDGVACFEGDSLILILNCSVR